MGRRPAGIRYLLIGGQAMRLPGVTKFDEAEAASVTLRSEHGTPVKCLCGAHLLGAKEAANRPQDQVDIDFLRELQRAVRLP